jgi:pimeloyl-ACP methyl ester carboxylesterase
MERLSLPASASSSLGVRWLGWLRAVLLGLTLFSRAAEPVTQPVPPPVEKVLPLPGQVWRVCGRPAFLLLPTERPAGRPTPWVWYAPTLPGLPGPEEKWMFERFLAAGIAVAGIDVGESYGSPAGSALFTALHDELVGRRGLAPKAVLLGRSRGGLMLINWAADHPDQVAGIAGIYPVCNLASYPGLARACGAYGLTEAELTRRLGEFNPVDRLGRLAQAKVPIFLLHGDRDATVPLEANSGALAQRYTALGGPVTLRLQPGRGHDMWEGWFQSPELVEFVLRQSGVGPKPSAGPEKAAAPAAPPTDRP